MADLDEPLVLAGTRGWPDSQAAYAGVPDARRARRVMGVGWYDTSVDEHEGAFCMARVGSLLEDLIGDVVRVDANGRVAYAYCLGTSSALVEDLALSRPAFLRLAPLGDEAVTAVVRPVVRQ